MLAVEEQQSHQDEGSGSADVNTERMASVFRLTVGFIVLVILTFVAVEGWRAWRDYEEAFAQAYDSVVNLSQATAQNAEDAVRQVDVLTGGLAERVEGDGLANLDVNRIHALLVEQAKLMPQLHGLFIYDAKGRWIVTDKSATPEGANNSDRDYFIYHRTHLDRHVRIGKVITSRSTNELIIPVSRRLNNPDGTFAGVLLGTMKVSYFVDYYGDFKMDGKGALVLTLRTGEILARRPFTPGITDQSIAQGEIFQRYLPTAGSGVAEVQAVVDGTYRIYGYRALTSYPLIVEAGLSRESVVGPWRHGVIKTCVVLLVLITGLVGFGFILLHQLRRRMRVEHELRRAHEVMQEMALTDSLTGLGNRRKLDMLLAQEINRARRQGYAIALIMLDVDYFKRYNDRYGHSVGDECLRRVAAAIAQTLKRPADLAIRYGGEEFTVLLPDTTSSGASLMASQILAAIFALGIEHSDHPLGVVTASAGVASSLPKSDEVTPEGMIKAADAFLYMAKENGRNRWYSPLGNSALEAVMESRVSD